MGRSKNDQLSELTLKWSLTVSSQMLHLMLHFLLYLFLRWIECEDFGLSYFCQMFSNLNIGYLVVTPVLGVHAKPSNGLQRTQSLLRRSVQL